MKITEREKLFNAPGFGSHQLASEATKAAEAVVNSCAGVASTITWLTRQVYEAES
jgi:hypothetical protein